MILIHQEEKDLIKSLEKLGLEIVPADLRDEKGGDLRWFAFSGEEIGAEVKQFPSGLLTDIKTERLTDQLVRMREGFDIRILFLKGFPDISPNNRIILNYWRTNHKGNRILERYETGWDWNAVMLYLFSSFWCLGTIPIWCPEGTLAVSIKTIYDWTQKPEEHGSWIKRLSKTTVFNKPNILVEILAKFPRMGEKFAKALLSKEGTLANVFIDAINNPEKLRTIKGIGKKRLDAISGILLREYGTEGEDNNSSG